MKEAIEEALTAAKESGLMDQLIQKYWGQDLETLDLENRTIIKLKLP